MSSLAISHWDGSANTTTLATSTLTYPAANAAAGYSTSGTAAGDWYLPSIDELSEIYNAKYEVNKALGASSNTFTDNIYWSSSELSSGYAWFFNFNLGYQGNYSENAALRVRAVRAF